MIKTRLTELLGIRHPIVLGGMSGATGADLVAAVSEAGGLGTLGVSSMTADEIRTIVSRGEGQTLELKVAIAQMTRAVKTLAASVIMNRA